MVGADGESYFAHVSKALILEAVREGVSGKDADTLTGLKISDDRARRALALGQTLVACGAAERQRSRFSTCVCMTNCST